MLTWLVVVAQGCSPGLEVEGNARHRLGMPRRGKYMVGRDGLQLEQGGQFV